MSNQHSDIGWHEISRDQDYSRHKRKIERVAFKLPNGTKTSFYIKREGPASCVLALTPDKRVIMVEQFRPGPLKVLKELPGGYFDADEDPMKAAARELEQETGFSGKIQFVGTILDDAYSTMERYCFVATDCVKIRKANGDSTEFVRPTMLSLPRFRRLLRSGQMTDVEVGYICLDFLGLL